MQNLIYARGGGSGGLPNGKPPSVPPGRSSPFQGEVPHYPPVVSPGPPPGVLHHQQQLIQQQLQQQQQQRQHHHHHHHLAQQQEQHQHQIQSRLSYCPQCGAKSSEQTLRLVRETCGHYKCRRCLLLEDSGCVQCKLRDHQVLKHPPSSPPHPPRQQEQQQQLQLQEERQQQQNLQLFYQQQLYRHQQQQQQNFQRVQQQQQLPLNYGNPQQQQFLQQHRQQLSIAASPSPNGNSSGSNMESSYPLVKLEVEENTPSGIRENSSVYGDQSTTTSSSINHLKSVRPRQQHPMTPQPGQEFFNGASVRSEGNFPHSERRLPPPPPTFPATGLGGSESPYSKSRQTSVTDFGGIRDDTFSLDQRLETPLDDRASSHSFNNNMEEFEAFQSRLNGVVGSWIRNSEFFRLDDDLEYNANHYQSRIHDALVNGEVNDEVIVRGKIVSAQHSETVMKKFRNDQSGPEPGEKVRDLSEISVNNNSSGSMSRMNGLAASTAGADRLPNGPMKLGSVSRKESPQRLPNPTSNTAPERNTANTESRPGSCRPTGDQHAPIKRPATGKISSPEGGGGVEAEGEEEKAMEVSRPPPAKRAKRKRNSIGHENYSHIVKKSEMEPPEYLCLICNRQFKNRLNIRYHIACADKSAGHACKECDRIFKSSSHLTYHMRTAHGGEKPYKCGFCEKAFAQSVKLKRHERTHTGERPFTCTTCKHSFTTKYNLKEHENIHKAEKPYICSSCGTGFADRNNLRRHELTHDPSRNLSRAATPAPAGSAAAPISITTESAKTSYQCPDCPRSFSQLRDLEQHQTLVHGNSRYECKFCSWSSSDQGVLIQHLREKHTAEINADIRERQQSGHQSQYLRKDMMMPEEAGHRYPLHRNGGPVISPASSPPPMNLHVSRPSSPTRSAAAAADFSNLRKTVSQRAALASHFEQFQRLYGQRFRPPSPTLGHPHSPENPAAPMSPYFAQPGTPPSTAALNSQSPHPSLAWASGGRGNPPSSRHGSRYVGETPPDHHMAATPLLSPPSYRGRNESPSRPASDSAFEEGSGSVFTTSESGTTNTLQTSVSGGPCDMQVDSPSPITALMSSFEGNSLAKRQEACEQVKNLLRQLSSPDIHRMVNSLTSKERRALIEIMKSDKCNPKAAARVPRPIVIDNADAFSEISTGSKKEFLRRYHRQVLNQAGSSTASTVSFGISTGDRSLLQVEKQQLIDNLMEDVTSSSTRRFEEYPEPILNKEKKKPPESTTSFTSIMEGIHAVIVNQTEVWPPVSEKKPKEESVSPEAERAAPATPQSLIPIGGGGGDGGGSPGEKEGEDTTTNVKVTTTGLRKVAVFDDDW